MDYSKVGAQSGNTVYWSLIRALKHLPYVNQLAALKGAYPDITQAEIEYYIGAEPKPARQYLPEGYVVVDVDENFSWEEAIAAGIFTKGDGSDAYDAGVNFDYNDDGSQCNLRHLNGNASPELIKEIQEYALANGKAIIMPADEVDKESFQAVEVYNFVTSGSKED